MAEDKKSFLLYIDNYTKAIGKLSYEQKGKLLDAIYHKAGCQYAPNPELDLLLQIAFEPIETSMERAAEKYEEVCKKRREAGKKGGRPKGSGKNQSKAKKPNGFSGNQSKTKKPDSDSDSDSDSDTTQRKKTKKGLLAVKAMRPNWWTVEEWEELIDHRKAVKATQSIRAYNSLLKEFNLARQAGDTPQDILNDITQGKGWAGYKWEWVCNRRASETRQNSQQTTVLPRNPREALIVQREQVARMMNERNRRKNESNDGQDQGISDGVVRQIS